MKSMLKIALAASVAMLVTTGCSKSDGNSTSTTTTPPPTKPKPTLPNVSGKLVDGYLKGSLVFADCNGNLSFDSDPAGDVVEPSTTTNELGDFNLTVKDDCKDAQLIASGGTNVDTGLPFSGVLMAPAGSENITPLTTLVAIDPAFAAKIEEYNISVDVDFAEAGVSMPADLLVISQQVVTAINVVSFNTKSSDINATISSIVTPLVESLSDANLSDRAEVSAAVTDSAVASFEAIAAADEEITLDTDANNSISASLTSTLATIATEIDDQTDENGSVALTDVNVTAIADAVVNNNDAISDAVTLPIAHITDFKINSIALEQTQESDNVYNAETTETDIKTSISADVNMTDAVTKSFNANLSVIVTDLESLRSAQFTINDINMSTEVNATTLTINNSAYRATVTGTDGLGNAFSPVELTGESMNDIIESSSTVIIIDMNTLFSNVTDSAGSTHPLGDFLVKGNYDVVITIDGLPTNYNSYTLHTTISDNQ